MPELRHPFDGRSVYQDNDGVWRYKDDNLPTLGHHFRGVRKYIQPVLPEDDSAVYEGRCRILNRIDQEYGCDRIIWEGDDDLEYCGLPEWDPFTNRCWDHGPGPLGSL